MEVGGGAAVVTPVGDAAALATALGRVVTDEELRRDLVRRGAERSGDYSWTGAATRLWELYREIASPAAG